MQHLNFDVVDYIISHGVAGAYVEEPDTFPSKWTIHISENTNFSSDFLASLCLVSKMWLTPARRSLYRVIPFFQGDRESKSRLFSRTIREVAELRAYVRILCIAFPSMIDIVPLLLRCRAVACDTARFETIPSNLYELRNLTAVNLDLTLRPGRNREPIGDLWKRRVFVRWDALQVLRLSEGFTTPPEDPFYNATPLQSTKYDFPSLSHLHLRCLRGLPPFLLKPNCLKTLVVDDCWAGNAEAFLRYIHHHAESLNRLEINGIDPEGRPPLLKDVLKGLKYLEVFALNDYDWRNEEQSHLFDGIPPSLRALHRLPRDVGVFRFMVVVS
jgi:hypothetical protein